MTNNIKPPLSFKHLTPENWLEHDGTGSHIVTVSPQGVPSTPTGDGWASMILTPRLSKNVPTDIVELFGVARGTLCYGFFFYPLYTLGSEQLYRVIEAAVTRRCKILQAPNKVQTYKGQINWLNNNGHIDQAMCDRLHPARELRNIASHTDRQSIYDQTWAVSGVAIAVELIDQLFDSNESETRT